jgi:anti-sigma B factor antagonist
MMLDIQRTTISPDILVMALTGRLALGRECQTVEWTIDELLEGGQKRVVFDLSKLEYMDSTGIGIIATCCGRIESAGGQVRLAAVNAKIDDLFRVTKLNRVIGMHPSVDEAIASLGVGA